MWTDMSEIVRPTRDGIHGREYISSSVDIGQKPPYLTFDGDEAVSTSSARLASDAADHRPVFTLADVAAA